MKAGKFHTSIAATAIIVMLFFTAGTTGAQITQVENLFGKYSLSVDGCENNNGSGQAGSCAITINKPVGATLYKVYMVASQTPRDGGPFPLTAPLRINNVNDYNGSISPSLLNFASATGSGSYTSKTRYSDVTASLSIFLNLLPAGANILYLIPDNNQPNDDLTGLEGRTLLVIWNDPNGSDKVISIALGATTSLPSTTFAVNTPPLNLAAPTSTAIAGLGINFSTGTSPQINNASVNSSLITTQAGGYDDGVIPGLADGNLFTVGDDADALGIATEKYDIKTALVNGSTSYTVTFENVEAHAADYCTIYYSVVSAAFQTGTITGILYHDVNTNFLFNTGEPMLPANITVNLYRDIDGTPGLNTATDQLVATTVTNASGQYNFPNITVGTNYMLQVNTADTDIPSNLTIETANPVLNVASNNAVTSTVDFGFTSPCLPAVNITNNITICASQTYQLPWGPVVNTSGTYADTIRNQAATCDSIINTVNLSVYSPSLVNTEVHICPNQTYQLPWGIIVNTEGIYSDTIRNQASCDSIINNIHLFIDDVSLLNTEVHICPSQIYQLPSGTIVSAEGIYVDTLRSQASCDSIINTIHLFIDQVSFLNTEVHICPNQTYQLPSGTIVNTEGVYTDTLSSQASCDSIINTIHLFVDHVTLLNTDTAICSNQTYQLPSGTIVSTAGVYVDTLSSQASCDSIINTIHLTVNDFSSTNQVDSIYEGQIYTLPSGVVVSSAGSYQSVLTNSVGCDSIITTVLKLKQEVADCLVLKNAFTPNGDGINDYWILYRYRCFKRLDVRVYNRYGALVYHADDYKNDWNGRYRNKPLPDATYYYVIRIYSFDGREHVFKNNVTILR